MLQRQALPSGDNCLSTFDSYHDRISVMIVKETRGKNLTVLSRHRRRRVFVSRCSNSVCQVWLLPAFLVLFLRQQLCRFRSFRGVSNTQRARISTIRGLESIELLGRLFFIMCCCAWRTPTCSIAHTDSLTGCSFVCFYCIRRFAKPHTPARLLARYHNTHTTVHCTAAFCGGWLS